MALLGRGQLADVLLVVLGERTNDGGLGRGFVVDRFPGERTQIGASRAVGAEVPTRAYLTALDRSYTWNVQFRAEDDDLVRFGGRRLVLFAEGSL